MEVETQESKEQIETPRCLLPVPQLDPWLVYFHGRRGEKQTLYSVSQGQYYTKNIPCMRRKFIAGSSHGWMVITDAFEANNSMFLLNPLTMQKIELPPWDIDFAPIHCVLSSDPSQPDFILLFIQNTGRSYDGHISLLFYLPCNEQWINQDVKLENSIEDAISCKGKIYLLADSSEELLLVETRTTPNNKTLLAIRNIGIGMRGITKEVLPLARFTKRRLVESMGVIYVVVLAYLEYYLPYEVRNMEVFKMLDCSSRKAGEEEEYSPGVCERVESLGDRAFFLCGWWSTSCDSSTRGIMKDTIYFTMGDDRKLYAFNLADKSMTVVVPCPNVKHNWSSPDWFLPIPSSS